MWNDKQPIYQQLRDRIVFGILEGHFQEGSAIPSIREVAEQYQLNPITVSKAYQLLVDEEIVEKHRGLGMFVKPNARDTLCALEKKRFIEGEWPDLLKRIKQLGINQKELFA